MRIFVQLKGSSVRDNSAGSDRWKIFRIGPKSHNVLTVDEIRKAVRTLKKNRAPQFVRLGRRAHVLEQFRR